MYYVDILKALYDNDVRYLLVGALAMNLHGAQRMTADMDIVADLSTDNLKRLVDTLEGLGFRPRAPIALSGLLDPNLRKTWIEEKNMTALSLYNTDAGLLELDILIGNPIDFEDLYKGRVELSSKDTVVVVASIDDLIRMKEAAGREQDKSDIAVLRKLRDSGAI